MNNILSDKEYIICETNFIKPIQNIYMNLPIINNFTESECIIDPYELYINNNSNLYNAYGQFLKELKSFWHNSNDNDNLIISIKQLNYAFNCQYNMIIKNRRLNISIHMSCNINDKNKCKQIYLKSIKRINTMLTLYIDNLQINGIMKNDYTFIFLYNDLDRTLKTNKKDYKSKVKDLYNNHSFYTTAGWNFNYYINNTIHNFMVVTRKKGFLGLLTHELGHCCNLDGIIKNYEVKEYEQFFKQNINKNINSGLFIEGLNNALSSVIHAIFISLESKHKISYKESISNEIIYSYKQVYKLLKFFNCSTINDLIINKNYYNVGDSVFEYVILRGIYFKCFEQLIHYPYNTSSTEYYNKFIKCFNNLKDIKWIKDDTISMDYYYYK